MEATRKYSKKREAILTALRNTVEHPSAEMLYAALKPEITDLSLGTVYRNLALFLENGDVVRIGNVGGQDRYDANTKSHVHFICNGCGSVLDLEMEDKTPALYTKVAADTGGSVFSHSLSFSGLCAECNNKNNKDNGGNNYG